MSRPIATIASYADLIEAFRARLAELELPYLGADAVAGLAEGHTSKLMCQTKGFGRISLGAMLDALGCDLVLVENPAKAARAREAAQRLGVEPRRQKQVRRGRPKRETYWLDPAA
jgi:hypothetical protein